MKDLTPAFFDSDKRQGLTPASADLLLQDAWGQVFHYHISTAYEVRAFIIIFLENIKNNINIKCDNKRPDPCLPA